MRELGITQESNASNAITGTWFKHDIPPPLKKKAISNGEKEKEKTLLANEGLLFHEFLAVHCPPKREQSPCTFVAGVLPVQIW